MGAVLESSGQRWGICPETKSDRSLIKHRCSQQLATALLEKLPMEELTTTTMGKRARPVDGEEDEDVLDSLLANTYPHESPQRREAIKKHFFGHEKLAKPGDCADCSKRKGEERCPRHSHMCKCTASFATRSQLRSHLRTADLVCSPHSRRLGVFTPLVSVPLEKSKTLRGFCSGFLRTCIMLSH